MTALDYAQQEAQWRGDKKEAPEENLCIHAGTPGCCPAGTLAHELSLGDCCARCERDGYLEEASRLLRQVKSAPWPQREMLRGELLSALDDWAYWSLKVAAERAANVNAPAPYPFVRKGGLI